MFRRRSAPGLGKRGGARGLKSRGENGRVLIEIAYREQPRRPLITYHLEVDEINARPVVVREWLRWRPGRHGRAFRFLDYADGAGRVIPGEQPDVRDKRTEVPLGSPDTFAVNVLGQLAENPRVAALRGFIMGWRVSCLSCEDAKGQPGVGPHERLSKTGDNLAKVVQHLFEKHPARLEFILDRLRERVPKIQDVTANPIPDGRLRLQIRDAPFPEPVMARFASDGTLRMLAYLALMNDSIPPPFIGIGEPENFLYPHLLYGLAEECRDAAEATQIVVTTHSPLFLNALGPREVRVLWRDEAGYTRCYALDRNEKVSAFMDAGAQLGDLWMEGHLGVGDLLTGDGMPKRGRGEN